MSRCLWPALLLALLVTTTSRGVAEEPTVKETTKTPGWERWQRESRSLHDDPRVVAYFDFQDGAGATLKNGAPTGPVLDGAIHDGQWEQGRWPGKAALAFNGTSSYVEIPPHQHLFPVDRENGGTGEMTIEVWFKAFAFGCSGLVDKSSAGDAQGAPYMLWSNSGRLCAYIGKRPAGKVSTLVDETGLDKDQWIHAALTITSSRCALYRDGLLCGTETMTAAPTDNGKPLLLGAMARKALLFKGVIDELVIYNRALSEAEIENRARLRPGSAGHETMAVTTPRGGERMTAGSKQCLAWTCVLPSERDTVRIELSTNRGGSWQDLSSAAPNSGRYVWEVPATMSDACLMRVTDQKRGLIAQTARPFAIVPASATRAYQWINVTMEAPFAPRDGAGALVHNERMWLLGGWNRADKTHYPRLCSNDVWSSVDGKSWKQERANTYLDDGFDGQLDWEGRHTAGYVVHNNKMWIVGGDANQGHYQNDVWNSTDGVHWKPVSTSVPWGPRALHYAVAFKDKIWVMGGQTMPGFAPADEIFYSDVWNSSDGVNWSRVADKAPWAPRGAIGGNAVFKDRLWILGGGTYDTPETPRRKFYHDVWSTSDGIRWECHVAQAPWEPRQYAEIAVFDGCIWVLEGFGPERKTANRNDVWYSEDGANWHELTGTPWAIRHAASVFVHDNALWMVAGNNMASDVWKLVRMN